MAKTRRTASSSKGKETLSSFSRAVPAFLAVSWTSDLVWKILHTLEENPQIRHGIWPGEREKSVGNTKIAYYEKLASLVFDETIYSPPIIEGKGGLRFYGNSIKAKCRKLLCQYKEVREEIGETGAGVTGEEEIDEGSTLANKWIEIKERCPYFFLLRDLLGERPNVTEPARANSKTQLDLDSLKRSTSEQAESSIQELESGFLDDVISLSDSIKYGEEENLNEFEYKPKDEVEIIGFGRKSDSGKAKDFTPGRKERKERKERQSTGIAAKSGSKHDRGKLPLSSSRPSWTTKVKEIVNTLLSQPPPSPRQDNHSNRCLRSSSYSKKYQKLTDNEEHGTASSSDHHREAWLELELEKLAVERDRMRHERDMMILKFRLERGDHLADIENM